MNLRTPYLMAGRRVGLRLLRLADVPAFYRGINDAELARWMLTIPHPYPKHHALRFWLRTRLTRWRTMSVDFAVAYRKTARFLGMVHLLHVDWRDRSAELACWIARRQQGLGFASEAIPLMCRYGFEALGLHKIWTRLFAGNAASRRVTEKCGFAFEGRLRHSAFKDGRWREELRYGLRREDWARRTQRPLVANGASLSVPSSEEDLTCTKS